MWPRLLPYVLTVVAVLAVLSGIYLWGRDAGTTKTEHKQLKATIEGTKRHERKTQEVIPLGDAALRERYCKWVRDNKSECLQADIPLREGQSN